MPLAFHSPSHGVVPFGYFHIDSDLLLLERRLWFTDDFTAAIVALAHADPDHRPRVSSDGFEVTDPANLGNVMGAIQGHDLGGLIGDTYRRYPFPSRPEDFRQRASGGLGRGEMLDLLARRAEPRDLEVQVRPDLVVDVAGVRFEQAWFGELVAYVWRGGYPRWLDGVRPDCVQRMRDAVRASQHPLFADQAWELRLCPC